MSEQRDDQRGSQLQSERGSTTISDAVVAQVAGIAAQEVEGVQMGGGTVAAVGGFLGNVTSSVTGAGSAPTGSNPARGVSVSVDGNEVAVDLAMVIQYGLAIPRVLEAVRRNVINRVENLVGLRVREVNITVEDVQVPEERPLLGRQQQVESEAREQERSR